MIGVIECATPLTYSQNLNREDSMATPLSWAMESRAPSGNFLVSRTSNVGGTGSRVTGPNCALSGGESSMKL